MKKLSQYVSSLVIFTNSTFAQNEWTYNGNPELSGWDSIKIMEVNRYLIDSTKVTGLVIVHNSQIVFDYGDIKENSYIASCRKSVLAMLYDKCVESELIKLNKTIRELEIDDVDGILPIEQNATIKDLISARSCVYHLEGYPGGMQQFAPERGSVKPGNYWLYSNWDFNVAGFVFEQETKKNIYDEIEEQLAKPLSMEDWDRNLQRKQGDTTISKYLTYPMWFSIRDMARIGLLMLNIGRWNDQEIISENWVGEMIKQRTTYIEINTNVPLFKETGVFFGYAYMWWLFKNMEDNKFKDAYAAIGAVGQAIAIYPEIDVVAYKTKAAYKRVNNLQVRLDLLKMVVDLYNPN